jgi:dTDP-4-amino-4,6-dideoxy-D-galactose acyltransferase
MIEDKCVYLSWDSDFFGVKTGKINCEFLDAYGLQSSISKAKSNGFKLIYFFCNPNDFNNTEIIKRSGGLLVDEKTTYAKQVGLAKPPNANISEFKENTIPKNLYDLAVRSGEYSRFKIDPGIGSSKFVKLYHLWLENSIYKGHADKVFVYLENGAIVGFVTLKLERLYGSIGLIAVDDKHQGKAIGSQLVGSCEAALQQSHLQKLTVVTQKSNKGANAFYAKMGFAISNITNIYHLWL